MSKTLALPTARTMTRNILRTFAEATPQEVADGVEWYGRARTLAETLANDAPGGNRLMGDAWDREVTKAAAVVAVLSPRLSWPKNVELAHLCYRTWQDGGTPEEIPTLKVNARKAFRILLGEEPDDVVKGPKVRAFWHTITDPHNPLAVVVDRHAIDVAMGRVLDDHQRGILLGRKGAYELIASAYAAASRIINRDGLADVTVTPAGVQAVTWVWWRANRAAAHHTGSKSTVNAAL